MATAKRRSRGYIETREDRPKGKFRAVAFAGSDPLTGRPRYLRKSADTYTEAQKELTKLLTQVDAKQHPRSQITVGEIVEKWLKVNDLEATTRQRYESLVRNYIQPTFGDTPAAKLDAELLERFYARLRRCYRLCTRRARDHECRPLSSSTVRAVHFILRAALDRAVRWKYLSINEAAMATPPAFERPEPDPPSAEEIAAVLNEAWKDPTWGTFLWLTMVTGCRRGEMCALRWADLDVERAVLTVERSLSETTGALQEKTTKTRQKRRIALDPHTVDLLVAHRAECESDCAALSAELERDAFMFSNTPDGSKPWLPSTITQKYRRVARDAGLRSTRFHSLRHYSATELLTAGVDLRTVAGRLGHGSGGATTLRFYAAWVAEADHRAAEAIGKLLPTPEPGQRQPRSPYERLAADLRRSIESGDFAPGAELPTCAELAKEHNVSVGTVNRAVALLSEAGLVHSARGKRTTVSSADASDQTS